MGQAGTVGRARNGAARPAATKGLEPRISRISRIRKLAGRDGSPSRPALGRLGEASLPSSVQSVPSVVKSSQRCAIPRHCGAEGSFKCGGNLRLDHNHSILYQLGMLSVSRPPTAGFRAFVGPFCAESTEVAFHKRLMRETALFQSSPVKPNQGKSSYFLEPQCRPIHY
jgi:hypothetical protein